MFIAFKIDPQARLGAFRGARDEAECAVHQAGVVVVHQVDDGVARRKAIAARCSGILAMEVLIDGTDAARTVLDRSEDLPVVFPSGHDPLDGAQYVGRLAFQEAHANISLRGRLDGRDGVTPDGVRHGRNAGARCLTMNLGQLSGKSHCAFSREGQGVHATAIRTCPYWPA